MPESQSDILHKKRSEYWFEDGNVILQAENTLFRLHRSLLSNHSQFFKNMFAMAHAPSQENEIIEGCPVIPLSDTAEDVNNIVSLLYDGEKTLGFGRSLPPRVLRSMLRLGKKYIITYLEEEALDALHHDFPQRLQDWDELYQNVCERIDYGANRSSLTITEIICMAHEFSLFTILPGAYVSYLQYQSIENTFHDTRIPEKAREHCIIGYVNILEYINRKSADALSPPLIVPSMYCSNSNCKTNPWPMINSLPVWKIEGFAVIDSWGYSNGANAVKHLCLSCRTRVESFTAEIRSELWSNLPTMFGLPDWKSLEDDF